MTNALKWWQRAARYIEGLATPLDWIVQVGLRCVSAAILLLLLVSPDTVEPLMRVIHENWRAAILLGVLLFLKPIGSFLEEMEEFFGAKRRRVPPSDEARIINRPKEVKGHPRLEDKP